MLVSSTSMNAATATTTAINQGLNLGRHTPEAADVAASVGAVRSGSALLGLSALSAMGSKCETAADHSGPSIGCLLGQNVFNHPTNLLENAVRNSMTVPVMIGRELQECLSSGSGFVACPQPLRKAIEIDGRPG